MSEEQPRNPLHGITLKALLEDMVERHGWEGLAARFSFRCFQNNPSITSSLTFLRKTPWAREELEQQYIRELRRKAPKRRP